MTRSLWLLWQPHLSVPTVGIFCKSMSATPLRMVYIALQIEGETVALEAKSPERRIDNMTKEKQVYYAEKRHCK